MQILWLGDEVGVQLGELIENKLDFSWKVVLADTVRLRSTAKKLYVFKRSVQANQRFVSQNGLVLHAPGLSVSKRRFVP